MEEEVIEKKLNFFERMFIAIAKPKDYEELSKQKVGNTIWTFSLITIIQVILISAMLIFLASGFIEFIDQQIELIPDFSISKEGIACENPTPYVYQSDDKNSLMIIDVSKSLEEVKNENMENIYSADKYLVVGQDAILVRKSGQEKEEKSFSDLFDDEDVYTKSYFVDLYKNFIYGTQFKVICIIIAIFVCIYLIIAKLVRGLIYGVLAIIISKIQNKNIKFSRLYNISMYATITTIILYLLQLLTFIFIPYWSIISSIIICVYIVFGIINCKSDDNESKENININEEKKLDE